MIKAIRAKNFLSWADLEFEIAQGITLIEGFNHDDKTPEGSGKSAILNALSWGLFGKIPKDANVDDVIREGQKTCSVEIEFNNGDKVIRSRKPNDLALWDSKKKDVIKGKDAKETQALIELNIGMSFETFCQSIYFAQNYPNKFVTAPEADKAKILSEIQDLEVFDRARKEVMQRIKVKEADQFGLAKDLSALNQVSIQLRLKIQEFESLREEFQAQKMSNIAQFKKQLRTLLAKLEELAELTDSKREEQIVKERAQLEKDYRAIDSERAKIKAELDGFKEKEQARTKIAATISKKELEIERLESKVEGYKNPKNKKCPTCGTVLEKVDAYHFASHISELNDQIKDVKAELSDWKAQLKATVSVQTPEALRKSYNALAETESAIWNQQEALDKERSELKEARIRIEYQEKQIKQVEASLEKEEAKSTEQYDEKIQKAQRDMVAKDEEIAQLSLKLEALKREITKLEVLKVGFREVKSFVFKGILDELNRRANRYLAELFEQPIKIKFSNEGEAGEISKILAQVELDGVARPLGLYSGGQFRRIQFAVDLALSDVVNQRSSRKWNLRILDEVFKDLSEPSMEKCLRLLEGLKGSTLLIEHNTLFKSIVSNSFNVELVDGVSRRT